jgi:hypothetical protein
MSERSGSHDRRNAQEKQPGRKGRCGQCRSVVTHYRCHRAHRADAATALLRRDTVAAFFNRSPDSSSRRSAQRTMLDMAWQSVDRQWCWRHECTDDRGAPSTRLAQHRLSRLGARRRRAGRRLGRAAFQSSYHRLFAHRSYDAAPWVRLFALLFGAASVQKRCAGSMSTASVSLTSIVTEIRTTS